MKGKGKESIRAQAKKEVEQLKEVVKELEIDIEYDCDYGVEFDYFSKNLESIKIDNLHPKYTKNLSKLKSLKNVLLRAHDIIEIFQ